jgi:hypothetical protein
MYDFAIFVTYHFCNVYLLQDSFSIKATVSLHYLKHNVLIVTVIWILFKFNSSGRHQDDKCVFHPCFHRDVILNKAA